MYDLVLIQVPNPQLRDPEMYFPLGILYIASIVEAGGYKIDIFDARRTMGEIPQSKYYGFSCTTPEIEFAKHIVSTIRGNTIIGGVHASLMPQDCIEYFDYVVAGEGEEAILNILAGKERHGVINASMIKDLDIIPFPSWRKVGKPFSETLFPGEKYGTGEKAATLIASRGCPYHCVFCGNLFRTPVRFRGVQNIVDELVMLKKMGVTHFRFEDDNFTIHPKIDKLCQEIGKLNIRWKGHTRSDLLCRKPEVAKWMYESGCEECGIGIESADDRVLKINKKGETSQEHIRAIKILKNAGMRAKVYLMAGLPGEDDITLLINKKFMEFTQPDKWTLSTFTPYPGCDVFNKPDKYGVEIIDWDFGNWWNFVQDGFVHVLRGQTREQMWMRYLKFFEWLKAGTWQS